MIVSLTEFVIKNSNLEGNQEITYRWFLQINDVLYHAVGRIFLARKGSTSVLSKIWDLLVKTKVS